MMKVGAINNGVVIDHITVFVEIESHSAVLYELFEANSEISELA